MKDMNTLEPIPVEKAVFNSDSVQKLIEKYAKERAKFKEDYPDLYEFYFGKKQDNPV